MSELTPRILVDRDLCEANGVCVDLAPRVFVIDEQTDELRLETDRVPPHLARKVNKAIARCPRGALSLSES